MAHIRSYFGIEREFDRYYSKLKAQLHGYHGCDPMLPDNDLLKRTVMKSQTRVELWDNPDPQVPLETGHLL